MNFHLFNKGLDNFGLNYNICLMRVTGMCLFFWFLPVCLAAQASRFEFQAIKMGTEFNLVIYGSDTSVVKQAADQAWGRIDQINAIFSDYSTTSELSRIHQYARSAYFPVSAEFESVLKLSLIYSRLTCGAFDISIGALTRLWRRSVKLNDFPAPDKIREAMAASGYKKIRFKRHTIKLPQGMFLDFGAIAKGYAVDEAYRVLADHHLPVALVDGGGDIYAGGPPPGKSGWAITSAIRDDQGMAKDTQVYISNSSIVTSGDAYKYIEHEGKRYSHIIDPGTGFGIPGPHWTTVTAGQAIHADALATALSVLSDKKIRPFQKKWKRRFPQLKMNWNFKVYRPIPPE